MLDKHDHKGWEGHDIIHKIIPSFSFTFLNQQQQSNIIYPPQSKMTACLFQKHLVVFKN